MTLEIYKYQLLQDFTSLALLTAFIGLGWYWLIGKRNQKLGIVESEIELGKVPVDHVRGYDLLLGLVFIFPFVITNFVQTKISDEKLLRFEDLFAQLILFAVLLVSICFFIGKRTSLSYAWGLRPKSYWMTFAWAGGGLVIILILLAGFDYLAKEQLIRLIGEQKPQDVVEEVMNTEFSSKLMMLIFLACVVAPIVEEVLFRGFLYPVMKRFTNPVIACFCISLLFGAVHGEMWALIPLAAVAAIFTVVFELSGSLLTSIMLHAMFNTFSVTMMLCKGSIEDAVNSAAWIMVPLLNLIF